MRNINIKKMIYIQKNSLLSYRTNAGPEKLPLRIDDSDFRSETNEPTYNRSNNKSSNRSNDSKELQIGGTGHNAIEREDIPEDSFL